MNTISKVFQLINKILDATLNVTDETLAWTDEAVAESQLARQAMANDRNKRIALLTSEAEATA